MDERMRESLGLEYESEVSHHEDLLDGFVGGVGFPSLHAGVQSVEKGDADESDHQRWQTRPHHLP